MKEENIVKEKSFEFAVRVVGLYKHLTEKEKEFVMSKQMMRSGTAVGALVREAEYGESKSDFIHKLSIALKEANETKYWLLLLHATDYLPSTHLQSIETDLVVLIKLLTSIINTTRRNLQS